MGIQDRHYYRDDAPGDFRRRPARAGGFSFQTITGWLIALNVAVYLLNAVLRVQFGEGTIGLLWLWGFFSYDTAVGGFQIWRFLTFQFLHSEAGIGHLLFNMIGLFFFGPMVESFFGHRRYLAFYLLCGVAGPAAYLLIMVLGILPMNTATPMVGASAGLFGILIAAAVIAPDTRVQLLFPPVDLPLKTMAWIYVGIAAFMVFSQGQNAGGEAAHLGGAALGFMFIRNPRWLNWAEKLSPRALIAGRGKDGGKGNMKFHGWR